MGFGLRFEGLGQAGAGLKDLLLALQALPSHQAAGAGGSGGIGGAAGGDAEGLEVLQGALACAAAQAHGLGIEVGVWWRGRAVKGERSGKVGEGICKR